MYSCLSSKYTLYISLYLMLLQTNFAAVMLFLKVLYANQLYLMKHPPKLEQTIMKQIIVLGCSNDWKAGILSSKWTKYENACKTFWKLCIIGNQRVMIINRCFWSYHLWENYVSSSTSNKRGINNYFDVWFHLVSWSLCPFKVKF